jgi:hypothetical protein
LASVRTPPCSRSSTGCCFGLPPHVADAANLRRLNVEMTFKNGEKHTRAPMSYAEFAAIRDGVKAFDRVGAFLYPTPDRARSAAWMPRASSAPLPSADYFRTLGVRPEIGRFFLAEDDDDRVSRPAAVLGYDIWQRRFAGRSDVIGEPLVLEGNPYAIVGVAPKGFSGADVDAPDVWVPLASLLASHDGPKWRDNKMGFGLQVIAHLAPGADPSRPSRRPRLPCGPAYEGTFLAELPTAVKLGSVIPGRRLDRVDSGVSVATRLSGRGGDRCCSSPARTSRTCCWRGRSRVAGSCRAPRARRRASAPDRAAADGERDARRRRRRRGAAHRRVGRARSCAGCSCPTCRGHKTPSTRESSAFTTIMVLVVGIAAGIAPGDSDDATRSDRIAQVRLA